MMAMRHKLGAVTAAALVAALGASAMAATAAVADDGPVEAGITVQKVEDLPSDFINGVDISSVLSLEESGVVFRDRAGQEADLFEVLADHGINSVRLRVWNDPYNSETGAGYGGGNVDAERAGVMAKRATDAGMNVLMDFHYSDFWAHPGQQDSPKAWEGLELDDRVEALSEYTTDALQIILDAGGDVGMVQIGNETNGGQIAGENGWANTGPLFAAGAAAVKEMVPDALVAVHWANPNDQDFVGAAQQLENAGVDYDVFASSYYPFWHGSLENLTAKLTAVAEGFGKDVMVAETSWPYTLDDGDGHENTVRVGSNDTGAAYPFSVQGQATQVRDVIQAVVDVGDAGIGVYYWEPAWLPVGPAHEIEVNKQLWEQHGSGWAASHAAEYSNDAGQHYGGSAVDNQALFDFDGNPLESLRVFEYARTGSVAPRAVSEVENPSVTFTEDEDIELPATVRVDYNDLTFEDEVVTWSAAAQYIEGVGTYEIDGETASGHPTTVTVTVNPVNLLVNGDFEAGDETGWTITADPWPTDWWVRESENDVRGKWALGAWQDNDAEQDSTLEAVQIVTGLETGTYSVHASGHGAANDSNALGAELFVDNDGEEMTEPFPFAGWDNWRTPTINHIEVGPSGVLTVGMRGVVGPGSWLWIDDFVLTPQVLEVDTSHLESLVERAQALRRDVYTDQSLVALDAAIERARVVLAAVTPTTGALEGAESALETALDGLEVEGDVPPPTVEPVSVTFDEGETIVLPDQVTLRAFDGSTSAESVTWSGAQDSIVTSGTFTVSGVSASGYAAVATVVVIPRNWLINGGFEKGIDDVSPWEITAGDEWPDEELATAWVVDYGEIEGEFALNGWSDEDAGPDFWISAAQATGVLPAGTYELSAISAGGNDVLGGATETTFELGAWDGSNYHSIELELLGWPTHDSGSVEFTLNEPTAIDVTVSADIVRGDWAYVDDVRLERVDSSDSVDVGALESALADAEQVDRAAFTNGSLEVLDLAVERGEIVLAASRPGQDQVDAAVADIAAAIAGLVEEDDSTGDPDPTPTITPTPSPEPTDPPDPGGPGDGEGPGTGDEPGDGVESGAVHMHVSHTTVRPGDEVTITVTGAMGATVEFGVQSVYQRLATANVVNGTATATVTIPSNLEPGSHHLLALDEDGTVLAQVEITVLAAANDGELSTTGIEFGDVALPLAIAVVLLVAGLGITVRARRTTV